MKVFDPALHRMWNNWFWLDKKHLKTDFFYLLSIFNKNTFCVESGCIADAPGSGIATLPLTELWIQPCIPSTSVKDSGKTDEIY